MIIKATEKGSLKKHIESVHEKVKYPCHQCEYKATTKGNIQRHIQKKHFMYNKFKSSIIVIISYNPTNFDIIWKILVSLYSYLDPEQEFNADRNTVVCTGGGDLDISLPQVHGDWLFVVKATNLEELWHNIFSLYIKDWNIPVINVSIKLWEKETYWLIFGLFTRK